MKCMSLLLLLLTLGSLSYGQTSTHQIKIRKGDTYLNFPVTMSDTLRKTQVLCDGKVLDEFTIRLSKGKPDFWVFFDASPYQGKTLTIKSENLNGQQKGFNKIFAESRFPGEDSLYKERLRPQIHFSSRRGWNNDPNGLIFANGVYHLFYQHNPYGTNWGDMHWGHAVSKDLLHWKEQPGEAWYTPDHDDAAFSGSAVVDPQNTSGFRKNGIDPIIAFYTSTGRGECIALSYDNGKTFKDYAGDPVLKHRGRDPKVFWYAPGKHWVMVVYDESHKDTALSKKKISPGIAIYTSADLKHWTYQSILPGFYECPNLFQLPVEGDTAVKKWIIYGGDGRYKVGDFDGKKFTVEQGFKTYDHGGVFYASQIYDNIPAKDGRQIQIGWARIPMKNMPFNQCMTFPTELTLKKVRNTYCLCPKPIDEIKTLYKNNQVYKNILLDRKDSTFTAPVKGQVLDIIAEFEDRGSEEFGININGYKLTYNNLLRQCNGVDYPLKKGAIFKVEAIVDKTMIEIYINDGELYFVKPLNSVTGDKMIRVFAHGLGENGNVTLKKLEIHRLQSVW